MAQGVITIHDVLVVIFEQISRFFKRLEEHAKVPMTDAMTDIMVKIMVEVLEIFAIMTREIKRGRASESIPDNRSPMLTEAQRGSSRNFSRHSLD